MVPVMVNKNVTHGHARRGAESPTYNTWLGMLHRAERAKVKRSWYRNASVCKRWFKFENFLADMGEKPEGTSLDRINGAKGYTKSNCRWATPTQQSRNTKTRKDNTSGVRGVYWHAVAKKWHAKIAVGGKHINLGLYTNKKEAIAARKAGEKKHWGDER